METLFAIAKSVVRLNKLELAQASRIG